MSRVYGQPELVWEIPEGATLRVELEPLVLKWAHVLPDWLDVVEIRRRDGEDFSAQAYTTVPYRLAVLTFTPEWLAAPGRERELTVIHEMLHVRLGAYGAWARDLAKAALKPGGPLDLWATQQFRNVEEGVITELATMLLRSTR